MLLDSTKTKTKREICTRSDR